MFMRQFGYKSINGHELIEVKEGDKFKFGKHENSIFRSTYGSLARSSSKF